MPDSITRLACAKVNLFLNVLGRRADGYHELETLFERIGLADRLTLRRISGGGLDFTCSSSEVPRDGTNLVVRAVELFRQRSGWTDGLQIHLEKSIPAGAGLGGGSSDAAATLLALQELSRQALPPDQLLDCAKRLGADVPFFLADTTWALGRGRGDEITPLPLPARLCHLLVTPDFPIATPSVYGAFTAARLTHLKPDVRLLLHALEEGRFDQARGLLFNALEPAVETLYPAIRGVKASIEAVGLKRPLVSGSGSTVFTLCVSEAEAEGAAQRLRQGRPGWCVFVTATA